MNIEIYSKKAIEELLKKVKKLKNTAVISFYDPPNAKHFFQPVRIDGFYIIIQEKQICYFK